MTDVDDRETSDVDPETVERVAEAVDRLETDLVAFARDLVRVRSVQGDEAPAQELVIDRLEDLDLSVRTLEASAVSGIESHAEYSTTGEPYDGRPNVIAHREGAGGGRSLRFNGHVDVVPAGDESLWSFDPFGGAVEDGELRGRGASDMKGGVAAMIFAVAALEEAGIDLKGDLVLESVIEEEAGGYGGTLATVLDEDRVETDAVLIPEPTDFDLWIANDGVSYFRVTVQGTGAHAAETDAGVNAIEKLIPIFQALSTLHDERKTTVHDELFEQWHEHTVSLNLGTIRGGDWVSSVPDEATLEARISHAPSETRAEIQDAVESVVSEAAAGDPWLEANPPEVEWFGWRGSSAAIDEDEPIVTTVQEALATHFDAESRPKGFPGGLDTRFFVNYTDTPALCFGPGAYNIHGTDEYLPVEELRRVTTQLAVIAMEWCGYELREAPDA